MSDLRVSVKLHNSERSPKAPSPAVYLFGPGGKLIKAQPLTKDQVEFDVPDQRYVVTVGPNFLNQDGHAPAGLAKKLAAANAFSRDYHPALNKGSLAVEIPAVFWLCWFEVCIDVHGTVRKLLNPGSATPKYATICSGKVQIFQVDLGCTLDNVISLRAVSPVALSVTIILVVIGASSSLNLPPCCAAAVRRWLSSEYSS